MIKGMRRVWRLAAALLLGIALVASACAPKAPAKEKIVKVGYLYDLTGPVSSSIGKNGLPQLLAPYRNASETGLLGDVKIDVLWEDYAFNVDRAVAAYKKMKDGGSVVIRPLTTLAAEAIQPLSTRDKVPLVGNSTTDKLVDPTQWHYTVSPTYTQMFTTILKWVKDNWKDTSRKPRVAQIAWDAPIGRGHVAASEQYAKQIGVDVGPWEFIPLIPLDTTPNLLRIRDAKADFVVLQFGNAVSADQVLRDAKKLGIRDNFTWIAGFQVSHWEQLHPSTVTDAVDGIYGINEAVYPEESDSPGVKYIGELLSKYVAPEADTKLPYFGTVTNLMYSADQVVLESLKRANTKVGYEKLDGTSVKEAIEGIKGFDPRGLRPALTFGADRRQGVATMRILKLDFKAKTWRPSTGWLESPATYGVKGEVVIK